MQIFATDDIPSDALNTFSHSAGKEFRIEIHHSRVSLLSLEPPSWINFIAKPEWWELALSGIAVVYVAELTKEAGKATWKGAAKAASLAAGAATKIASLAASLIQLKSEIPSRTELVISLSEPNAYFGTKLTLNVDHPDLLEMQIALFVSNLGQLQALINAHKMARTPPATGYFLSLDDYGGINVVWFDGKTMKKNETYIPLPKGEV